MRKIIHIDMDAFFASVEQRDRPEIRGLPVIVGGNPDRRGVVSTCSYEARAFGIRSGMSTKIALRLCPNAVFLEPDFRRYSRVSDEIREIFDTVTNLVEPVSIDEAYLDVTTNKRGFESATKLAREIQREIYLKTALTASAGVSYNKFLAKVASDFKKPAGLTVIRPGLAEAFLDSLPIEKFHGIGHVTAAKFRSMNIRFGHDLRQLDLGILTALFGKVGAFYYEIVRGIDERPVTTDTARKSLGREITLIEDCTDQRRVHILLRSLAHKVGFLLQKRGLSGRTISIKVRYSNFQTVTRSESFTEPIWEGMRIGEIALSLSRKTEIASRPVRLLGVSVSNLLSQEELNLPQQLEFDF